MQIACQQRRSHAGVIRLCSTTRRRGKTWRSASRGRRRRRARPAQRVRLLAVSKTFPPAAVRAVHALGQRAFGENYVQEGVAKMDALADLADLEWHLIGPLQSNKTGPAARAFRLGADDRPAEDRRAALGRAARALWPPLDVCVQVNISGEASKSGVAPDGRRGAGPRRGRAAAARAARHHGHRRADRRHGAPARAVPDPALAVCDGLPRGGPRRSTRCRWACRPTSRPRSPRARRWCASGTAIFGRADA